MKIEVLENKKNRLVFNLKGEDHTFSNFLKEELLNDKQVMVATYAIAHPLINIPKFIIETDKTTKPKKVLSSAIVRLKKRNSDFLKLVSSL